MMGTMLAQQTTGKGNTLAWPLSTWQTELLWVVPSVRTWRLHGRRKPYTEAGLRRLPCVRCGEKAALQWQTCADEGLYRPVCRGCDILLNQKALEFLGFPDVAAQIAKYATRKP